MYYQAAGGIIYNVKKKAAAKTKENRALSVEAEQWKAMALMPVGKKMKIPSRRFIGDHPEIKRIIEQSVNTNLGDLNDFIIQNLKQL